MQAMKTCGRRGPIYIYIFVFHARYIATTQMQPTDARKTFPCFDEPGVKATYDVTLLRKSNMTSLANMNLIKTEMRYVFSYNY